MLNKLKNHFNQYHFYWLLGLLSAIPFMLTLVIIFHNNSPFYLFIDPDMAYFANALRIITLHPPTYIDHPGTPYQTILAIFLIPFQIMALLKGIPGKNYCLASIDYIIPYLRILSSLLTSIGVFLFSMSVEKTTRNKFISLLSILMLYSIFEIVAIATRISAEVMLIFSIGLFFYLFSIFISSDNDNPKKKEKFYWLACFCAGITITTKLTALPLIILLLSTALFLPLRKNVFQSLVLTVTGIFSGIIAGILPILPRLIILLKWIAGLIFHKGCYGRGKPGFISLGEYIKNITFLINQNSVLWAIFLCVLITFLVKLLRGKKDTDKNISRIAAGLSLTIIFGLLLTGKYSTSHYLIPTYFCIVYLILIAVNSAQTLIQKQVMYLIISVVAITACWEINRAWDFFVSYSNKAIAFDAFTKDIEETANKHNEIILWTDRSRGRAMALGFANFYSGLYRDELLTMYPNHRDYGNGLVSDLSYWGAWGVNLKRVSETNWKYAVLPISVEKTFHNLIRDKKTRLIGKNDQYGWVIIEALSGGVEKNQ